MISITKEIPSVEERDASLIKLRCLYECYPDDSSVMFWSQNDGDAYISLTDENMIIYNKNADLDELCEFVSVISPCCVFSDLKTLKAIGKSPKEEIFVYSIKAQECDKTQSDELSSKELYRLLDVDGLSLPEYPFFAVDYCRRLNMGNADYFAIKDTCAAISFNTGRFAIMNGIASHKKGYGSIALKNILGKNKGRDFLVCCRQKVKLFYEKNGFEFLYKAGYWVK